MSCATDKQVSRWTPQGTSHLLEHRLHAENSNKLIKSAWMVNVSGKQSSSPAFFQMPETVAPLQKSATLINSATSHSPESEHITEEWAGGGFHPLPAVLSAFSVVWMRIWNSSHVEPQTFVWIHGSEFAATMVDSRVECGSTVLKLTLGSSQHRHLHSDPEQGGNLLYSTPQTNPLARQFGL